MNGSPSSVLTMGLGSWGSTGLMLTLGLGVASGVAGAYCIEAATLYAPGAMEAQAYAPGAQRATLYAAGAQEGEASC